MPLTRRATDMGLMARLVDKYDGTDDEGGVSLCGEEQLRDGWLEQVSIVEQRINFSLGTPEDDMNIVLDSERLGFGRNKYDRNDFQGTHHNTARDGIPIKAAVPLFNWNPRRGNRRFHQNLANIDGQKELNELPENESELARIFAESRLSSDQLNHGFDVPSHSNFSDNTRNYKGHHSIGSDSSGGCPYAGTPGAFGSPSAAVYGVFPKYPAAFSQGNATNRPPPLPTIQISSPHENITSIASGRMRRPPERGLEAWELAQRESWHATMYPINPIITSVNENV
ncbi:hypothetical protein BDD12DRAFT_391520 [Trichophaea hybrida]|nr:hypothetical protein BDD12DRAFT_391520 [Trichophaea hybrida]